jgi:SAM-dependent methyltransferase
LRPEAHITSTGGAHSRWPAAAPPPDDLNEPIPVVLPAPPVPAQVPRPTQSPTEPTQRIFAKRVEPPRPKPKWPWTAGAAGGVVLFGCIVVGVAEMAARRSGGSLFGNKPTTPTPAAASKGANADQLALDKAKAPPLSPGTVEKMLELAKPQREETLFDLGCGNGQVAAQAAEKYGLYVKAYDSEPALVNMARRLFEEKNLNQHAAGVELTSKVLGVDLSHADIIVIVHPNRWGTLRDVGEQLEPRLIKLKPGVRIISTQPILEGYRPWETKTIEPPDEPGRKYTFFIYKTPLE